MYTRVFLSWGTALADGVAQSLLASAAPGLPCDLGSHLVIVPSQGVVPMTALVGADSADADDFDLWGQPAGGAWLSRQTDWQRFASNVQVVRTRLDGLGGVRTLLGGMVVRDEGAPNAVEFGATVGTGHILYSRTFGSLTRVTADAIAARRLSASALAVAWPTRLCCG